MPFMSPLAEEEDEDFLGSWILAKETFALSFFEKVPPKNPIDGLQSKVLLIMNNEVESWWRKRHMSGLVTRNPLPSQSCSNRTSNNFKMRSPNPKCPKNMDLSPLH